MTYAAWLHLARSQFPGLDSGNSRPTSPADDAYNCIAWAAKDSARWWWPDPQQQYHWPPTVPRIETLDAFEMVFKQLGYTQRTDVSVQPGVQKVAIFVNALGKPTHAARQLSDGWWASKLGPQIDIEHKLSALEGPVYGTVGAVLAMVVDPANH